MKTYRLSLDFTRAQHLPGRARQQALACCGLLFGLAAGGLIWQIQSVIDQREQNSAHLRMLSKAESATDVSAQYAAQSTRSLPARTMLQALSTPWEKLLGAIEQSKDHRIILDTLRPDVGEKRVEISGRAVDFAAIADFLTRLSAQAPFVQALLTSETNPANSAGPIRFVVSARWAEGK